VGRGERGKVSLSSSSVIKGGVASSSHTPGRKKGEKKGHSLSDTHLLLERRKKENVKVRIISYSRRIQAGKRERGREEKKGEDRDGNFTAHHVGEGGKSRICCWTPVEKDRVTRSPGGGTSTFVVHKQDARQGEEGSGEPQCVFASITWGGRGRGERGRCVSSIISSLTEKRQHGREE